MANAIPPDLDDSFLTVAEVAAALRLNPQTVRNWIDQGSLPALRVGRRVRIRRSDFERLLEEGYSGGAARETPSQQPGPSAEDFWSGEAVGTVQPSVHAAPGETESEPQADL
jgi:excisionase family DNA binding protein